jgi:hypothetical protein
VAGSSASQNPGNKFRSKYLTATSRLFISPRLQCKQPYYSVPMHPAVLLLLRLPPLLQLLAAAAASNKTGSCAPARCGELNITYPFSLSGVQPLDCGFPVFDLTCDFPSGQAYLSGTFRERLYHVQAIFYGNRSLVVAVETAFSGDETCRIPDFNVSSGLALFPLYISSTNRNLTFIYNCDVPSKLKLPPKTCANHSIGAFFSEDDAEETRNVSSSCTSVSLPVRGLEEDPRAPNDYVGMINDGFLLEWPQSEDCDACVGKGGECRFVDLSFQCGCSDARPCHTSSRGKQRVLELRSTFQTQIQLLSQCAMIFIYL